MKNPTSDLSNRHERQSNISTRRRTRRQRLRRDVLNRYYRIVIYKRTAVAVNLFIDESKWCFLPGIILGYISSETVNVAASTSTHIVVILIVHHPNSHLSVYYRLSSSIIYFNPPTLRQRNPPFLSFL